MEWNKKLKNTEKLQNCNVKMLQSEHLAYNQIIWKGIGFMLRMSLISNYPKQTVLRKGHFDYFT